MSAKRKLTNSMVVGDSTLRNIEPEHANMKVECFPGIKTEHLNRVIAKRDMGSPETVIIDLNTDDLRKTRNLDFVMEVYALMVTAKRKMPNCRLVLSGVL